MGSTTNKMTMTTQPPIVGPINGPISNKIRSSQGCWTCRLRRKKCDEAKPVCAVCAALEITCHFGDAKPAWMDGGAREAAVADELKAMVKTKANERRERRWMMPQSSAAASEHGEMTPVPVPVLAPAGPTVVTTAAAAAAADKSDENLLSQSMNARMALGSSGENTDQDHEMGGISSETGRPSSVSSYNTGADGGTYQQRQHQHQQHQHQYQQQHDSYPSAAGQNPFLPWAPEMQQQVGAAAAAQPSPSYLAGSYAGQNLERDMHFVMIYLDYVMPFLFPFYRPSLAESGRGWLLVILMKNKALFHTALSLASYFFSVALEERDRQYEYNDGREQDNDNNHGTEKRKRKQDDGNSYCTYDPRQRTACQETNWAELQTQTELAIRQLQHDMAELNARGIAATPLMEGVRCLESIIQLLQFESAIAATDASENWPVHLDAATALFRELVAHHHHHHHHHNYHDSDPGMAATNGTGGPTGSNGDVALGPWTTIFQRMGSPYLTEALLVRIPAHRRRYGPFSSDQSAFRFYSAYLVWADVVAATARGEAPRLREFHDELLEGVGPAGSDSGASDNAREPPQLALEDYIGCRGWAVRLLGEVASLAAWKKDRRAAGSLSIMELVQRAAHIESRLRHGLAELDLEDAASTSTSTSPPGPCPTLTDPPDDNDNDNGHDIFAAGSRTGPEHSSARQIPPLDRQCESAAAAALPLASLHTRAWAHAALAYLAVTVHGYQPGLAEVAGPAAATLGVLRALVVRGPEGGRYGQGHRGSRGGHHGGAIDLRTLAWPFAVAGCCLGCGGEMENGGDEGEGVSGGNDTENADDRAFFIDAVAAMGAMRVFGTVGEALDVVRRVWALRDAGALHDPETWDIAACLGVLGHRVLLV